MVAAAPDDAVMETVQTCIWGQLKNFSRSDVARGNENEKCLNLQGEICEVIITAIFIWSVTDM